MDYKSLYIKAREVMANAYSPYSNFKVGAALLTKSGEVFTGVNIENASYGATICAERSAIVAAVTSGFRDIEAIAVTSSAGEVFPCGICRQSIFEFGDHIKIITGKDEENLEITEIKELLPRGFRL